MGGSFFGDFRKFIMRGNAIDMAVGIVIGAAFTGIVNSLVNDVIMPPLGLLLGNVDFANWFVVLKHGAADANAVYHSLDAAKAAGATTLNIGLFINSLVSFIIVALAIFLVIRLTPPLQISSFLEFSFSINFCSHSKWRRLPPYKICCLMSTDSFMYFGYSWVNKVISFSTGWWSILRIAIARL